jgi:hypothetical protein
MVLTRPRAALPILAGFLAVLVGATACGDGNPEVSTTPAAEERTVVIASQDIAVGQGRFTFVVLDRGELVTDQPVYVRFFRNADSPQPTLAGQSVIPWVPIGAEEEHGDSHTESELTGIYYVNAAFDEAGSWGLGVTLGETYDANSEIRVQFTVKEKTDAPAVGAPAIPVNNPTTADLPLQQIHTGSDADPAFHSMTIGQAITSGKPTVIAFATPSFCRTRTCGPALQVAIELEQKFGSKANFIHVEPYELDASGSLVSGSSGSPFKLADPAVAWNLPSEPWVFVIDASGTVVARFEGAYTQEELDFYLTQVTAS